jgi:hypothetical protein
MKNKTLKCEYKSGYFGCHWTIKDSEKGIFSGESSSYDFMIADANYWAKEEGETNFKITFTENKNLIHRAD